MLSITMLHPFALLFVPDYPSRPLIIKWSVRLALTFVFTAILLLGGCRSRMSIPYPTSDADGVTFEEAVRHTHSPERRHLIEISREWIGTPYEYAKSDKGIGTDCSGMVLAVYLEATSLKLPRNSAKQAEFCININKEDVAPGDLVFFATGKDSGKVSHVGIMLDEDNFIHASSSKGVCISKVSSPYYLRTFLFYGRVPGLK